MSSDGMDLSFCGTERRWWVHALSRSAEGFVSNCVTSGVCLQACDCTENAWIFFGQVCLRVLTVPTQDTHIPPLSSRVQDLLF